MAAELSLAEKQTLLALARQALEAAARGQKAPPLEAESLPPALREPGSCFVTLMREGQLRGCIGGLTPDEPLWADVRRHAAAAALDDYRFSPVAPDELPLIEMRVEPGPQITASAFAPSFARSMPSASVSHGHEGVERFFRDWLGTWTDYEIGTREFVDAGDSVVIVFRQHGTGRESGVEIERDFFGVYDLRASKVVRFRMFESRDEALQAAGPRE